jgi:hypothetical protein
MITIFMKRSALILSFLFALTAFPVHAATGSMSLRTSDTSVKVNDTFVVGIYASADADVNALGAELTYSSDLVQVVSVAGPSVITLYITQGVVSDGTVAIEGGIQPAKKLSGDRVGRITFRAKKEGTANFAIAGGSGIYANDGQGTNLLVGRGSAKVTITGTGTTPPPAPTPTPPGTPTPPPAPQPVAVVAPTVSSSTHPDAEQYYPSGTVSVSWSAPGADKYAYVFDQVQGTIPETATATTETTATLTATGDGVWYLHVRAHANGEWGPTTQRSFGVDTTAPSVTISCDTTVVPYGGSFSCGFGGTDALSGVDHYESAFVAPGEAPIFERASSPVGAVVKVAEGGTRTLIVRAYDKAGNMIERQQTISAQPSTGLQGWWTQWQSQISLGAAAGFILILLVIWLIGRRKRKAKKGFFKRK